MSNDPVEFIDVKDLRIGHYVFIDMAWMSHPFPVNSFKINNIDQLTSLRSLGLEKIRFSSGKSDPAPVEVVIPSQPVAAVSREEEIKLARRQLLADQQSSLRVCERLFDVASKAYRVVTGAAAAQPEMARDAGQSVVDGMVASLLGQNESSIRLLSERMGDRGAQHSVNVTILSLLLGKSLGLPQSKLADLAMGAFMHDLGKIDLPDRLRYARDFASPAEQNLFREHVAYGVTLARKMTLPPTALLVIAQHHEHADGSGYPQRVTRERMTTESSIVALINYYDTLCNPGNPGHALTPHEALAQIYAQAKLKFDSTVLGALIRMMGVYPPGSVVQLTDERYALVVSVNASRPLKPRLIVFDEKIPATEALIFDLDREPGLSIRRSLRPLQLPRAVIDYLVPCERFCYYFEHARESPAPEGLA